MFEITRRTGANPMRSLMEAIAGDPFFAEIQSSDEGNLALDISQDDEAIVVRASLPGFRKDDIDVQIHNGVLSIKATRSDEQEEKNERFYRKERRMSSMSRRIALPGVVAHADADAQLADGVLTLRVPIAEVAKPKTVSIN